MDNVVAMVPLLAVTALFFGVLAFAFGYFFKQYRVREEMKVAALDSERILTNAKAQEREILLEAKDAALKIRASAEAEQRERRAEVQRQERRILQKEENLDRKMESLERRERSTAQKEKEVESVRTEIGVLKKQELQELERISTLTTEQAKDLLLKTVEDEIRLEAARRARIIEQAAKEDADRQAAKIIAGALQRCASDHVAEMTVSVVPLPNDEMKGRIIGREGRNIRALENATGVDLIVDDTPDAVTLSAFDPVRREIARVALEKLIMDGRIHPARIEEVVQKATAEVETVIREAGERACYEAGVQGVHPELIKTLGRLKFRTSYGQNVLMHSVEVAHLAAMIASELRVDVNTIRVAGLLHDIGKALSHEVEGPHALIGADLVKRFGKSAKVVAAIAGHHGETEEPQTLESVIVQAADAISGARPGARRETVESYIKRLEALENVANSFAGVERSFAIQAGREVRIIVKPEEVDDLGTIRLARDIVKKIEETLEYPGQIKVTVMRETRAVDYAK